MKKVLAIIVLVAVSSTAFGARTHSYSEWRGSVSSDWNTAANWNNTTVPVVYDTPGVLHPETFSKAGFKGTYASPDLTGKRVAVDQVVIGGVSGGTLTVAGGIIDVSEFVNIGNTSAESGVLNINEGGTVNCGVMVATEGRFILGKQGSGVLNMNGGTLNLTSYLTIATDPVSPANGTVNLNSGFIYATDLQMANGGLGTARIVVKDGFLILNNANDLSGKIQGWINNGWISAAPGYTVYTAFDADSAITTVWATPEPATIGMLLLGGMIVRRLGHGLHGKK